MHYKDYYKIMGIERNAKPDEIKQAYRKLARKYHPDVSKEKGAEEKFKELQEAYAVLKDSEKRAAYDQLGKNWNTHQEFSPPPGWEFRNDSSSQGFNKSDAGHFSDFFETLFGGGWSSSGRSNHRDFAVRGQDIHSKISVTLEEVYSGVVKEIQLNVPRVAHIGQRSCQLKTLRVNIPAGVASGQQIRLASQGGEGFHGGARGDLYLEVSIQPNQFFTVDGKNVLLTLPISPWEAALGAKISVPTLAGKVEMVVPKGVRSGKKLRLKGRGLPGKVSGDQYVILQIVVPEPKDDIQRQLYEKMKQEMSFNPRAKMDMGETG